MFRYTLTYVKVYFCRDDKPYCADCFGELFSKRCTACSKPITGKNKGTVSGDFGKIPLKKSVFSNDKQIICEKEKILRM
jgi:hypothetical protein